MTKQHKPSPDQSFVGSKLPWVLAGAAFLLYLLTLNHWISLSNLGFVARGAGWAWGVDVYNPVFFLLTLPIRALPVSIMPLAYNLFSAVCGALAAALLARSAVILPHNRTQDQRLRERNPLGLLSNDFAWLPPLFAGLVFILQLTVWENSTTGSNDVVDVLLVAYIINNLLEYRLDEKDSRLFRAALVCGAAMANSWLVFVLFPAFLASVIWIKKLEFFNARFLLRMLLFGVLGTLFYLLLPTVQAMSSEHLITFGAALKMNLAMDKQTFVFFFRRAPLSLDVMLIVTSLLPLLIIGIRWASNFGDPSKMGTAITKLVFHVTHLGLLLVLLWMAFDPVFSPRRKGFALTPFSFIASLGIGYLVGYFLIVFRPLPERMGRSTSLQIALNRVSIGLSFALLVIVPLGLLLRNLPQVRLTNGPALKDYATQLVENLPSSGVILSDDSRKLYLAQALLTRQGTADKYFFLDTQMLSIPGYHAFQKARHPEWPELPPVHRQSGVGPNMLIGLLFNLSASNAISYLHPSFGYYFEAFDQRPQGMVQSLVRYPTNSISGPALTEQEIAVNEKFWTENESKLEHLADFIAPPALTNVSFQKTLGDTFHIPFQPNATALTLGGFYSQALNFWGVQLQSAGKLDPAGKRFRMAVELFPDNFVAENNLALNRELKSAQPPQVKTITSMEEELGKYRSWDQALRDTGPFDDPTHRFSMGLVFAQGNNFRQAAQQLERVHALVPDHLPTTFWLSRLYVINQQPQKAIALLNDLRKHTEELAAVGIRKIDLVQAEAGALYVSGRSDEANTLVRDTIRQNLNDPQALATVVQLSSVFKNFTNALIAVDQLLKLKPNDAPSLLSKGVLSIQSGKPRDAIEPLTKVITLQGTNYGARLYRAVAYLGSDQLDEAKKDYENLQKTFPNSNDVNGGLGEIAFRQKDTNSAIQYFERCLKNLPPDSPQATYFSDRINSLKTPSP